MDSFRIFHTKVASTFKVYITCIVTLIKLLKLIKLVFGFQLVPSAAMHLFGILYILTELDWWHSN